MNTATLILLMFGSGIVSGGTIIAAFYVAFVWEQWRDRRWSRSEERRRQEALDRAMGKAER